jgi:hypothetical protein
MKLKHPIPSQEGSVLVTALLTITILALICATSLYVATQNQNAGMQTASWQQALGGAESGIDTAVRALNTGSWSGWSQQPYGSNLLPNTMPPYTFSSPSPAPTASASGTPPSGYYNYYYLGTRGSPGIVLGGVSGATSVPEGNTGIWGWVTVDTAGLSADTNGQWYRIRATGAAGTTGLFRVSSNKLDNDLRNSIGLHFDRKTGAVIANPQATRTIEVIMQPLASGGWARGITLKNWVSMSGGGSVDSFDSSNPFKSSTINGVPGQYDVAKRQSHGDIGSVNSGSSDLRNTYVYGNLAYSGTPVKNTTNVQGTISTPFNPNIASTSAPNWAYGSYVTLSSGNPVTLVSGTKNNPTRYKINGDLTVPGGASLSINNANGGTDNNYIQIWVTGKLTTSGSGYISQNQLVKATWYVGKDITVSGDSYNNQSGLASSVTIVGYGSNNKATISGSANFIATLNAPGYDTTVSGSGSFVGALVSNTLTISGSAGFHYDEALSSGAATLTAGNYAFASWFEDNSDPSRGIIY